MGIFSNKARFLHGFAGLFLASVTVPPAVRAEPLAAPRSPERSPQLREVKAELRAGILSVAIPEVKAHREDLLALEKRLASAEDFAGALEVRRERAKVESKIVNLEHEAAILASRPTAATASRLAPRIEFKLSDAKLAGAKFDAKEGAIVGLDQLNASATWQMPFLPAGGYEVLLACTGAPGEVIIKEGFYSLTGACKETADKTLEQNLGTLRIRAGGGTLTVGAANPEKSTGWRLYSLVLLPPTT